MTATVYLNAVLYLIAIIGVILLLAWLVRKFGLGAVTPNAREQKRLKVVASVGIDAKRRLAIVKCDDKEYLLLVGGNTDILVDILDINDKNNTGSLKTEHIKTKSVRNKKSIKGKAEQNNEL